MVNMIHSRIEQVSLSKSIFIVLCLISGVTEVDVSLPAVTFNEHPPKEVGPTGNLSLAVQAVWLNRKVCDDALCNPRIGRILIRLT